MGFFSDKLGAFGAWLDKAKDQLSGNLAKLQGKGPLERLAACAFLIANSDGDIDADEIEKFADIVKRNAPQFSEDDARAAFTKARENGDTNSLLALIGKAPAEEGETLVMAAIAIGSADGEFDDDEKAMARRICTALFIQPSKFDL